MSCAPSRAPLRNRTGLIATTRETRELLRAARMSEIEAPIETPASVTSCRSKAWRKLSIVTTKYSASYFAGGMSE